MALRLIDIGTTAGDGTGDTLRRAMDAMNDNLFELYSQLGNGVELYVDFGINNPGDSSLPNNGDVLTYDSGSNMWINSSGGVGTVTSVGISGSTGITVSNTPITGAGSIVLSLVNVPNSALANSTVSYGGISLSLGGTDATPAFNLTDATNTPLVGSVTKDTFADGELLIGKTDGTLTNATLAAGSTDIAITNGNGTITIDLGTTVDISGKTVVYRSILNADVGASAAIAYSKLNLTGGILNADVGASAAIAYSKLNLTAGILDADISGSANIVFKNTVQEFTKQQNFNATTLTDGASIAWDLDDNQASSVTLAGNRTLANPTNMKDGATYILVVKQDATGTRTLAYGTAYEFSEGTVPVLSTGANAVDMLAFYSDGVSMFGSSQLNFS
jgi:hypothetical protein